MRDVPFSAGLVKPMVAAVLKVVEAVAVTDVGTDGALTVGRTGSLGTLGTLGTLLLGTGVGGAVTVPLLLGTVGTFGTGVGTGLGETIALGEGEGDGNCGGLGLCCAPGYPC